MEKKPAQIACWIVIAASGLLANYAAQHHWPLWSITIAGAFFVGAVVAYVVTTQSR